jgi:hypothetical protein
MSCSGPLAILELLFVKQLEFLECNKKTGEEGENHDRKMSKSGPLAILELPFVREAIGMS